MTGIHNRGLLQAAAPDELSSHVIQRRTPSRS
jgi:hypothetical protein